MNPGKYRHYKGGKYEVLMTGKLENSHEEMVIYKSLSDSGEFLAGTIWIRPLSEFKEKFTELK